MLEVIDHTGQPRYLGNLEPSTQVVGAWRIYGDSPETTMVAKERWPDLIMDMGASVIHPCLPPTHDQGQVGQCNAEAITAGVEFCRKQQGLDHVQLSAGDLYGRINHGKDRGSLLEDGMEEITGAGVGTARTCGTLWYPQMPEASREERARYCVLERWLCPTWEHRVSALLSGFALIAGVWWYAAWSAPDGDGWMPERGSGRRGGHAMMAYRPMLRHGSIGLACLQSWGRWGLHGCCVLPETACSSDIGGWWAIRQVTSEPTNLPPLVASAAANRGKKATRGFSGGLARAIIGAHTVRN